LMIFGVCLILFFGSKSIRSFLQISLTGLEQGTANVNQIRGWMTIPYIATAYQVPEAHIFQATKIPISKDNKNTSLSKLGAKYYGDNAKAVLLPEIQQAILNYQSTHPNTNAE